MAEFTKKEDKLDYPKDVGSRLYRLLDFCAVNPIMSLTQLSEGGDWGYELTIALNDGLLTEQYVVTSEGYRFMAEWEGRHWEWLRNNRSEIIATGAFLVALIALVKSFL